jgi:hypothetical protein
VIRDAVRDGASSPRESTSTYYLSILDKNSWCNEVAIIVECRPMGWHTSPQPRLVATAKSNSNRLRVRLMRLSPQSSPQEERKREHKRTGAEVKVSEASRSRRSAVFQGSIRLIRYRVGALADGLFTGVAEAIRCAALAPSAGCCATGKRNGGVGTRVG